MKHLLALLFLFMSPLMAHAAGEKVAFNGSSYKPGTILIKNAAHELYYVLGPTEALRYSIAVGADGMRWLGRTRIAFKRLKPAWQGWWKGAPVIPGGAPNNPMGAAALQLRGSNYAIHGTHDDSSIGKSVSHGCIRMHNADILELYEKVSVGDEVIPQP